LGGIFVSYRRSDSQGEAGRLFDDLVKQFGEDTVFMDVAAIEAGRDFRKAIEEGVTKCGVLLVVIGLEWLDAKDERGARRLNDSSDFVRIETASALKRDIPVIPVLVRGAKMPSAEQLPDELKELAYRNCIELTHARWRSDMQLLKEALRRLLGDTGSDGTTAGSSEARASARPGITQQEVTGSSKLEDGNSSRIDAVAVQQVTRELALRIGPIAGVVVRRAASHCSSVEDLYLKVAEEIDSRDEREKFLLGRAPIPSAPPLNVEKERPLPSNSSRSAVSPPPSEASVDNGAQSDSARLETGKPSSNRRNPLLLAGAGGVFLVLLLVFAIRLAPWRGASSSQPPQTSDQLTHIAASAPANANTHAPPAEMAAKIDKPIQSPTTGPTGESQSGILRRVRIPEKISSRLLIKAIPPAYPVLARQAHVQGNVVLSADISKDGVIETLKVISGNPLLIQAALNAAKQWRFKPYVLNGEAVAVNTQIVVGFTLTGG
jgi:TonB family protein